MLGVLFDITRVCGSGWVLVGLGYLWSTMKMMMMNCCGSRVNDVAQSERVTQTREKAFSQKAVWNTMLAMHNNNMQLTFQIGDNCN